jgi:hypothetical protein
MHGLVDNELYADRGGEVKDHVAPFSEEVHGVIVSNVLLHEAELGMFHDASEVAQIPGTEIVQGDDLIAAREERLRKVRTDETGPAGNESDHEASMAVPVKPV